MLSLIKRTETAVRDGIFQPKDKGPLARFRNEKAHENPHMGMQMPELRQDQRKARVRTIHRFFKKRVVGQGGRVRLDFPADFPAYASSCARVSDLSDAASRSFKSFT